MSEYKELQQIAKKLGLPHVGVSEEGLRKSIQEKEAELKANNNPEDTQPPEGDEGTDSEPQEKPKASQSNKSSNGEDEAEEPVNTATVSHQGREVRRYTRDIHGAKFADLAEQYAKNRGYTVKLENVKPGVTCPSCGHVFYPA